MYGQNDGEISFLGNNRHMRLPILANFVAADFVRMGYCLQFFFALQRCFIFDAGFSQFSDL